MQNKLWVIGGCAGVLVFGAGVLLGRLYPAHHYEKITGPYLMDTNTGKVCFLDFPNSSTVASTGNPIDDELQKQKGATISSYPACNK